MVIKRASPSKRLEDAAAPADHSDADDRTVMMKM